MAWREADRVLDGLLDLPPERRAAALAAATLDDDLRALVQRLLNAHDCRSGPLEAVPVLEMAADADDTLKDRRLGRWRLLEQIGRGGMAVVYRAVSTQAPVGQQAAVKVLTLGALAGGGRERFLREQQLLSRLRHPGIVPLYDAGIADDGTPWLAMALIDGVRIDAWCERHRFEVEQCIDLVLQVADALAHAHRSLVIHRDIKPSNVLVDDDGHAQLLDFGIARLDDDQDAERTATALRALTPEYAAPEQFLGAPPSTAMDVYGLGALLYRILTGRSPRPQGLQGIDTQTLPPSRVVQSDPALPSPTRRLWVRRLRGDLDTVVMKALARQPEQRYASVEALAEDLRRWRGRHPVRARPQSRRYRAGRFAARHRLGVTAAALLALTLATGVAGTLWQAQQARQQAVLAQAAQQRTAQALARSNAIRDFLFELFRTTAPGKPREQLPTTAELLAAAVEQLPERFRNDPETEAEFLAAIAEVYYQRNLPEHVELRRRLLQLRAPQRLRQPVAHAAAQVDLAQSLATADASEQEESQRLFAEAIAQLERSAPDSTELAHAYRQRGTLHMHRGDGAARLRDSERAWAILAGRDEVSERERFFAVAAVAAGHHQAGGYAKALGFYDQAIDLGRRVFGREHVHPATLTLNRSGALSHLGRFAEAEAGLLASLADYARIFDKPRGYMLAAWRELELLYYRQGRYEQALQARDQWDRLLHEAEPDNRQEQAKSQLWRARDLVRLGRAADAEALLHAAAPVLQADGGSGARNRLMAASSSLRLACDRALPAIPPEAREQALALAREMNGQDLVHAAEAHAVVGYCALRNGDSRQALRHLQRAATLHAALPRGDAAEVAEHLLWRGQALTALGETEQARTTWAQAQQRLRSADLLAHPVNAQLHRAMR
ncbi:serine/threonine-protein kinase [Luteimonas suaedae]|uniref:serine/threonine-protein kinase n=1 Tax=Luteimonas suaedae TaxID=2605430 RepID=UPI001659D8AE|nr:serine/threonine-protein kinase [Luteimonas suaedae]